MSCTGTQCETHEMQRCRPLIMSTQYHSSDVIKCDNGRYELIIGLKGKALDKIQRDKTLMVLFGQTR